MIVFENKFSAIICQTQQSSIATATLRSPLGFCRRSSPVLGGKFVCFLFFVLPLAVFRFPFSAFRFPLDWLLPPFESGGGKRELEVVRGC